MKTSTSLAEVVSTTVVPRVYARASVKLALLIALTSVEASKVVLGTT